MILALAALLLQPPSVAQPPSVMAISHLAATPTHSSRFQDVRLMEDHSSMFAGIALRAEKNASVALASTSDTRPTPVSTTTLATPEVVASLSGAFIPVTADPPSGFIAGPGAVRKSNRSWATLVVAQHAAATFDAWSTRRALSHPGRSEGDPLMRPFAHSGAIYGAIQVGPVILDYVGRRMSRSQHNWVRKLWWVPQSAATVGFMFSGVHNVVMTR
jgi:hypothetical protein